MVLLRFVTFSWNSSSSSGLIRRLTPPKQHIDTSDAHYHRLHRFPEILEKRSARLEREKLIHERSKLILEIEDLKGKGWVYTMGPGGGSTAEGEGRPGRGMGRGGKGEEDRKRKLKACEERLKRLVHIFRFPRKCFVN